MKKIIFRPLVLTVVIISVIIISRYYFNKSISTNKSIYTPKTRLPVKQQQMTVSQVKGDTRYLEDGLKTDKDILYFGGFEGSPSWQTSMHVSELNTLDNLSIVDGSSAFSGRALRTFYKKSSYGGTSSLVGTSSTIFKIYLDNRGIDVGSYDSLYFRFMVQFQPGFNFQKSGKLPGLAGGIDNAGGNPPNGYDGWSGRLDWIENGGIINYMYVPGIKKYGLELPWKIGTKNIQLTPGKWECLEMHYKLNTLGKSDGLIEGWYNNHLAIEKNNIHFRDTDSLKIDNIFFTTFFGGATPDYASPQDQYATFDNFVLATSHIGCPPLN